MSKSLYWKKRFELLEQSQNQLGILCYADIEKQYRQTQKQIEGQLSAWYQRFASNNGVTVQEARKMLTSKELEEFKWDINQYIQYGEENAINGTWMKQLENASARYHISRLEALKIQTQQSLEVMFGNQLDSIDSAMRGIYTNGYYHTAFEIQKGVGVGWDFSTLDDKTISKVINKPWGADGKNFSERIWGNRQKLVNELNTELTRNIMLGQDPQKAIDAIAKKMNTSKTNAGRLVMTEEAFFSSAAQKDCFNELDVEQFEIVATLDSHTSEICQDMDGKHFLMSQWEVGTTAPPFHVNCRSTTVPYFDDDFGSVGERAARGADGKTYFVPGNMKYKDWEKAFVDGDKTGLQEASVSDTISVQEQIADADTQIADLKKQFSDITEGYSYDDWFKDFSSVEEGYGEVSDGGESFEKLKTLDQKIKDTANKKTELLHQKEKRKQLDTGYGGKVPDDELDAFNVKALEQIKLDTGYSDEEATEFQKALQEYFGGDYTAILSGKTPTAKIIRSGIERMPVYDGSISRGMIFDNVDVKAFTDLQIGDELPQKGIIESWSSERGTAIAFSGISDYERSSVILECVDNKTAVGVQHLSSFGSVESEVLSCAKYEVVEVVTQSKYDYLSDHREYLYFPEDLEDEKLSLKGNVVCIIKVKEKN